MDMFMFSVLEAKTICRSPPVKAEWLVESIDSIQIRDKEQCETTKRSYAGEGKISQDYRNFRRR